MLLIADLLVRAAELAGLQVMSVIAGPTLSAGQAAALDRGMSALNIHPFSAHVLPGRAAEFPGAPADVWVAGQGASRDGRGVLVSVGPVREATPWDPEPGHDLLAGRLAHMSCRYHDAADVTATALASAASTLSHWRDRVAEWAEAPSEAMPAGTGDVVRAAIEDDLDTAAALEVLRRIEAGDAMPVGARFETFAYADRLLGLDVARRRS